MAEFNFTQLSNVNQNSGYISFSNSSINDGGTATFEAFTPVRLPFLPPVAPPIPLPTAILNGDGGPALPVTSTSFDLAYQSSINTNGATSFVGARGINPNFIPSYTGVFKSDNGNLQTVVDNTGELAGFGLTSINDRGDVSFFGRLDSQETGIFTSYNGQLTPIAQSSADLISNFNAGFNCVTASRGDGPFCGNSLTSINNQGTVAFTATLDAGGTGVFAGSGGEIATIANNSGSFNTFGSPDINDAGTIAFSAASDSDSNVTAASGIFTSNNGELITFADTSGLFSSFGSDPAINNNGTVAFLASLDNGVTGIFTGSDPVTDQVVAVGDQFFGSTVTQLAISNQGLNDAGQLSFSATLADGRQGVFRAEPVPEPGDGISVLVGVLFLLGWWRHQKQYPRHD